MRYDKMLQDKHILITAGASQIGKACALLFASHGGIVAIADKDKGAGKDLLHQLKEYHEDSRFYHTDLGCSDSVKDTCDRYLSDFGAPDVWLNCEGLCHPAFIDEQEEAPLREMINLNILSTFRIMKYLAGPMKEKQGGAIIQMISDYAVTGANGVAAYGATMGGLFAMTNSFAMDYAPYGIRVNSILLGISLSAMGDIIAAETEDEEAEEFWVRTQMIPRRGRVQEVADTALFLASDMGKLITAEGFFVNGGQNSIAHNQHYRWNWGAKA